MIEILHLLAHVDYDHSQRIVIGSTHILLNGIRSILLLYERCTQMHSVRFLIYGHMWTGWCLGALVTCISSSI